MSEAAVPPPPGPTVLPIAPDLRRLMFIPVVVCYLLLGSLPLFAIDQLSRTEVLIIEATLLAVAAGYHWLNRRLRSARVVVGSETIAMHGGFGRPDVVHRRVVTGVAVGPQARGTDWVPVIVTSDGTDQAVTIFARGNEVLARADADRIAAALGLTTADEPLGPVGEPDTAAWYQRALI